MSTNETLKGVTVLSGWVVGVNVTLPPLSYIVDGSKDIDSLLQFALPFLFVWLGGLAYGIYRTDDDGYVYGRRSIESKDPERRRIATAMTYILEGLQVIACSFGADGCSTLMGGSGFRGLAYIVLWMGPIKLSLGICATVQLLMMMFVLIPMVLWFTIKRETFNRFAAWFISGKFGIVTSLVQDCFLIYLPLPIFMQLIRSIPCTYYVTGEAARAMDDTVICGSYEHRLNAVTGAFIFFISFVTGVASGTIPALVARCDDMALNGRFVSVSFAIKGMMAVVYVVAESRHRFYHLALMMFLQMLLVFISFSMRPCLVERINFHRSAIYTISIATTSMCIIASALDDSLSPVGLGCGLAAVGAFAILLVLKYYFIVCHKLFPCIDFEEGEYEGDLSLGYDVPHGHGVLSWPDEDRVFTGNFFLGRVHGYGMLTFAKVFYQGDHFNGQRHGFGMTNIMENEEEESFEGFWLFDLPHGQGTKKFVDGNIYEGTFMNGLEHGGGKWTFDTTLGKTHVLGTWENGVFLDVVLDEDQEYQGEIRYGVPHGEGTMTIGDDVFEGEWRAGKLHGFGRVQMSEGSYEGHFCEGLYSDEGIWTDQNGVYSGHFLLGLGLKHGQGREETSDGVFEGQFEEGSRQGYGTFTYSTGAVYQGSWRNNEYHGWPDDRCGLILMLPLTVVPYFVRSRGHITFSNGMEYIGSWTDDQFHGEGRLRVPNVGEYEGKFLSGNRSGLGKMLLFDGSEYVGEWDLDLPHGNGQLTFTSMKSVASLGLLDPAEVSASTITKKPPPFMQFGGEYGGTFEDGEMHGYGVLVCQDGSKFEGEFRHNIPHGRGSLIISTGGSYEGEWVQGEKEGHGVMVYPDNRKYIGEWLGGRRHGHGELFAANGNRIHECEWAGDVPIQQHEMQTEEDELIPTIDIDEFLRDIMPAAISPSEIEEARFRKRIEVEEVYIRIRIPIILDEQISLVRVFKHFVTMNHHAVRAAIIREQQEEFDDMFKVTLAKVLNVWKTEFRTKNDREPKKSDLLSDNSIAPVYRRYMELTSKGHKDAQ
ncbi:Hypothetical protein, putative [Bodo saltans]|uniref:Uncharacterized protein n=1 Tax=Bodo saltans TaxID=75058 RepID=A0A0S4J3F4_BODSA|nr:Hypothetical protein, putative [Bodo saltans]|eukprot:CUG85896.1 Hypothetical protein, putative [Bodo saltans]